MSVETTVLIAMVLCQFLTVGISLIIVRDIPDAIVAEEIMEHGDMARVRRASFRFGAILCFLVNLILFAMLEGICLETRNPIRAIAQIASAAYSYQTLLRMAAVLLVGCLLACMVGFGVRLLMWGGAALHKPSPRTVGGLMAALAVSAFFSVMAAYCGFRGLSGIRLGEICRRHAVVVEGEEDNARPVGVEGSEEVEAAADNIEEQSYVTLTNRGALAYHLDTVYLSDDGDEPEKFVFHDITIPAGGESRIDMDYAKGLHLTKSGGTTIYLTGRTGDTLDSVTVPALEDGTAYHRESSGEWDIRAVDDASLLADASDGLVSPPVFSKPSGFYDDAFALSISSDAGTTVHYTLDCSTPTADSPAFSEDIKVYDKSSEENRFRSIPNVTRRWRDGFNAPAPVDKAFIVRAVAIDESGNQSAVKTASYFIGLDGYRDKSVVSLVADPDDLFDDETGIYVTGKEYDDWDAEDRKKKTKEDYLAEAKENAKEGDDWQEAFNNAYLYGGPTPHFFSRGDLWERPSDFAFFEDGSLSTEQCVGVRVMGNMSRNSTLKRFSLFARKEYSGDRWFAKDFFGTGVQSHSVTLRDGFINSFAQELVADRNVSFERSVPVTLFLNGEYWIETYLCEKQKPAYFYQYYGVTEDNIAMAKNGAAEELHDKSDNAYRDIVAFLNNNDMGETENLARFEEMADLQSYLDYWCINVYLGNWDTEDNWNIICWHAMYPENDQWGDGRWRWALHDLDGGASGIDFNKFSQKKDTKASQDEEAENEEFLEQRDDDPQKLQEIYFPHSLVIQPMYTALKESRDFCRRFVVTMMDLLNTDFAVDNVSEKLEAWGQDISYNDYYFQKRGAVVTQQLAEEFKLHGSQAPITITTNDSDAGAVTLNTIQPDLSDGEWTGQYFTDYPVTVSAEPADGYEFVRWEIDSGAGTKTSAKMTDNSISFGKGGATIHVEFRKK